MPKIKIPYIFLLLLIYITSVANATSSEDLYGTYQVGFQPIMIEGQTQFCLLNFSSLVNSSAYEINATYSVGGNLGIGMTKDRSNVLVTLKVGAAKVNLQSPNIKAIPKRPYFAYLISPSGKNNSSGYLGGQPSDSPGGLTSGYNFDDAAEQIFTQIIDTKKVSVAFNLEKGQIDIVVPLDLTVVDVDANGRRIKNDKAVTDFKKCILPLMREAAKKMGQENNAAPNNR